VIKTFLGSVSIALLLAVTSPGPLVAQSSSEASGLLGTWHSNGVGNCPSTKNPGRPRMSPTTFNFTGANADNTFAGNFTIGCNGPSGTFDSRRFVAKLNGGQVVVELNYSAASKYTYTFATAGGAGEMVTPSGDHTGTIFEYAK
jgi:hypothetical protein